MKIFKKFILSIIALSIAIPSVSFAAVGDTSVWYRNGSDDGYEQQDVQAHVNGKYTVLGFNLNSNSPRNYVFGSTLTVAASSTLNGDYVVNVATDIPEVINIYGLIDGINTSLAGKAANVLVTQSNNGLMRLGDKVKIDALSTSTASVSQNGLMSSADKIKLDAISTSTATVSQNGLMSSSDKSKLDSYPSYSARTFATTTRSFATSTGAVGFQPSSTRDMEISYGVRVVTTATIGTPSEGYVALEISPSNSASAGSWTEVARCGNGQNITLAALLSSVQSTSCTLTTSIPTGWYAKLRQVTVSDSPSFTYLSGWERGL